MLTEVDVVKYVVKVNGMSVGSPQISRSLAEGIVASLPPEKQQLAEIVVFTSDNKEMLLG